MTAVLDSPTDYRTFPPEPPLTDEWMAIYSQDVAPVKVAHLREQARARLRADPRIVAFLADAKATMVEGKRNTVLFTRACRVLDARMPFLLDDLRVIAGNAGLDDPEIDLVIESATSQPRQPALWWDAAAKFPEDWIDVDEAEILALANGEEHLADEHLADEQGEDSGSSWDAQSLDDVLDGTYTPEIPELMPRTDGPALIYRGRVHSFHGETESGKSLLLQGETVRVLAAGGRVLFLDFESDRGSVVRRLLDFGVDRQKIRAGFVYVNPDEPPTSIRARAAWAKLLSQSFDLCILDGVTDAMNALGFARDGDVNDQATRFLRAVPKRIAGSTGAAVVLIDHVTKATDGRGRFAIGAQAKMSGLTGASYTVEVVRALARGQVGELVLRIGKDRPAGIRQHCSPKFRASDRTQEAARIQVDSTGPHVVMTIRPPADLDPTATPWRPTALMQRVLAYLVDHGKPVSKTQITRDVTGKREHLSMAVDCLLDAGEIVRSEADGLLRLVDPDEAILRDAGIFDE